jgi:hypothetical protein
LYKNYNFRRNVQISNCSRKTTQPWIPPITQNHKLFITEKSNRSLHFKNGWSYPIRILPVQDMSIGNLLSCSRASSMISVKLLGTVAFIAMLIISRFKLYALTYNVWAHYLGEPKNSKFPKFKSFSI